MNRKFLQKRYNNGKYTYKKFYKLTGIQEIQVKIINNI